MAKQKKKATFLKATLIERTNMFQEIIQQLTDNHDQIITKFQEKIDSDKFYYSLIAQLISPTDIHLHVETEYDTGQIEGLCLKIMTIYIDHYQAPSEDDVKILVETELEKAKKNSKTSSHNFQMTHASSRLTNLKKSNLVSQQTSITTLLKNLPKSRKNPKSLVLIALAPILRKINHV